MVLVVAACYLGHLKKFLIDWLKWYNTLHCHQCLTDWESELMIIQELKWRWSKPCVCRRWVARRKVWYQPGSQWRTQGHRHHSVPPETSHAPCSNHYPTAAHTSHNDRLIVNTNPHPHHSKSRFRHPENTMGSNGYIHFKNNHRTHPKHNPILVSCPTTNVIFYGG